MHFVNAIQQFRRSNFNFNTSHVARIQTHPSEIYDIKARNAAAYCLPILALCYVNIFCFFNDFICVDQERDCGIT